MITRYSWDELKAAAQTENAANKQLIAANSAGNSGGTRFVAPDQVNDGEGRNKFLCSLAASLRNKNLSEEALYAAVSAENQAKINPPLDDKKVREVCRWAMKQESSGEQQESRPKSFARSDLGNAERYAASYANDLRWCHERECWYRWDGKRWRDDGKPLAESRANLVARGIGEEAEGIQDDEERKRMRTWANKSESSERLAAMVRVAKTLPAMRVSVTQFDASPWFLNCENGVLNLRNGELLEHGPDYFCSKLAPVRFVAGARSSVLDSYLTQTTGGDQKFICFLQRALGYSLCGDVGAEVLFLVLGPGGSGKTTLVEGLKELLGDYSATVDSRTLLSSKNDITGPRTDIARLIGKRMVGASELEKGKSLAAALVKSLTGGERVTARNLYEAEFEFQPMAKFWLAANDAPKVDDEDSGMWRRIVRIPFTRVIPEADRDPKIKEAITKDPDVRSAILAWALQGCLDWQSRGAGKQGLAIPEIVSTATKEYREDQNPLRDFFDDRCERGTELVCPVVGMKVAYATWAREIGLKAILGPHELKSKLCSMGFNQVITRIDGHNTRVWKGFQLLRQNDAATEF